MNATAASALSTRNMMVIPTISCGVSITRKHKTLIRLYRSYPGIDGILESLKTKTSRLPTCYLLTGVSGTGKTVGCCELAESARNFGLALGGVVSPGMYVGDQRVAINLQDVSTDETRRLAKLRSRIEPDQPTRKWEMDSETISWGNRLFRELGKVDLLFVDEIGPLEFIHSEGLLAALQSIDHGEYGAAVIASYVYPCSRLR